ncbi:HAD hydrolase-like protein [Corynebacterium pseudopelargi]|uniref:Putative hydrolase YutF n=1 Tax=Corynebacterium pseudopelargi TaxID=2080757 RepID=A0A3G6IXI3_9CORY|nr:HAD hydrolase-like protein [Corynebacterium pseudopelargi]AZA09358.1 putative hydrolase YutF [Corynebacterium pseudopelargi]
MSLREDFDALLLDLDGTVWEGGQALPDAIEALNASDAALVYITNNASRGPEVVAKLLSEMGIPTASEQVLTSAQAAIEMAQKHLLAGAPVLVLGSDSFKALAKAGGFEVVASADEQPQAVLHGHNPATGWAELSEAALAIAAGAHYFASNLDTTLPSERGLCVGNGSMVAAVTSATGVKPQAAGKPQPAMFYSAVERVQCTRPLAVGDRLDTDIAGAVAADMPTLHLLSGVSKHWALIRSDHTQRPTMVAATLAALDQEQEQLIPSAQGGFVAQREGEAIVLSGGNPDATALQALRTVLAVAWQQAAGFQGEVIAASDKAAQAMQEWS